MSGSYTVWSQDNSSTTAGFPYESMEAFYQHQLPTIMALNRFFTIVWYVVGFPGNFLAFAVWIQPRMRHSSGCYLAALAAADFLFLMLHFIFELQTSWDVSVLDRPGLCESFPVIFYSTQYLSPLLVLAFTVERFVRFTSPLCGRICRAPFVNLRNLQISDLHLNPNVNPNPNPYPNPNPNLNLNTQP